MAFPKKISELPKAGSIKNSDLFVLVHNDVTSKITFDQLIFSADSNTFVTGGTVTGTNLILQRNDNTSASSIDLSSLSGSTFSWSNPVVTAGNTSGDCITQLWISSISGCSPLHIGTGLVVNGEDSGMLFDVGGHLQVESTGIVRITGGTSPTMLDVGGHLQVESTGIVDIIGDLNVSGNVTTTGSFIFCW